MLSQILNWQETLVTPYLLTHFSLWQQLLLLLILFTSGLIGILLKQIAGNESLSFQTALKPFFFVFAASVIPFLPIISSIIVFLLSAYILTIYITEITTHTKVGTKQNKTINKNAETTTKSTTYISYFFLLSPFFVTILTLPSLIVIGFISGSLYANQRENAQTAQITLNDLAAFAKTYSAFFAIALIVILTNIFLR